MIFRRARKSPAPVLHAGDDDFSAVVQGPGVTVVDFWAPWCGPCRMMEPILEDLARERAVDDVRVVKVNVDQAPRTAEAFGVRSIPTLVFFRDGEPIFEMVGLVPKPVLDREVTALVRGDVPDGLE